MFGASSGPETPAAVVYVILLNWNGWRDTIACLESVLRLQGVTVQIVVCDNASSDCSVQRIRDWCRGDCEANITSKALRHLVSPAVPKPLHLVEYQRPEAEAGGVSGDAGDVYLLHTGANLGFAGGCNVGIRFSLARGDADYVWLLNNDTLVEPQALAELVARASASESIGIVGSSLCYFDAPDTIQSLGGGVFNPFRAMTRHIGEGERRREVSADELHRIEASMAYVVGASMLASRRFLNSVGLMKEDYFLYFEEMDWAERARRAAPPFRLAFAPRSIVYHKVGASAGTNGQSLLSVRLLSTNRLRFLKRFYPDHLPIARLAMAWEGFKSLLKGRFAAAGILVRAASAPVHP
jgi:GT2 family glycosyltransferase